MVSTKLALLLAVTATAAPSVLGYATYMEKIPNGDALGKSLGHAEKGYTPFGTLFSEKGKTWAGVCKEKWPGQTTLTVGAVLGDPCCKWTSGKPDFVLTAPNTAGTTCAADAAKTPEASPSAAPAAPPAAPSAAPAAGAAQNTPATPQAPGKVQPAQPAPGAGATGPVPAPVPAPVPVPGKAGNSTAPAPTPASSKLPGKPSGNAHKNCH